MKKRALIGIFGILCLFAVGLFALVFSANKGEVLVVNRAAESVARGQIEICKQKFTFGPIKPSETKHIFYKVWSDSHYKITVEFQSGKKLTRELGYVTSGVDFSDTLIVKDNDILLENRSFR